MIKRTCKIVLVSILLINFSSCKKSEEIQDPTGIACEKGYYGPDCDIPFNESYFRSVALNVNDDCTAAFKNYATTISLDNSDPCVFYISNFWDSGALVTCTIKSTNRKKFTASKQPLGTSSFYVEITSGTLDEEAKTLVYTYKLYTSNNTVFNECSGTINLN